MIGKSKLAIAKSSLFCKDYNRTLGKCKSRTIEFLPMFTQVRIRMRVIFYTIHMR